MTNPNNIVRVRARNNGRASVYEANAWCQAFSNGLLEGNGVLQNTSPDMNVLVGGTLTKPDVLIAQNPAGYKTALDIVGQQAIAITAPASGSRISVVVAYTDDLSLASTDTETTGSQSSCGLIVVNGASGTSPTAPSDSDIRSAITADGATGSQASYAIIANITVVSSSTALTATTINVQRAAIGSDNIGNDSILSRHITSGLYYRVFSLIEVICGKKSDGTIIYGKTIDFGSLPNATSKSVPHGIVGLDDVVDYMGIANSSDIFNKLPLVYASNDAAYNTELSISSTNVTVNTSQDRSSYSAYVTVYYTKI